ncbi:response regulator [bacterium]|nr:response regulator [bacterium]
MSRSRILIVEDEVIVAKEIEETLLKIGYDVCSIVNSGEKAIAQAGKEKPDIILMDINLQGEMDGIEAAGIIRNQFDLPVVYLTAYVDAETTRRAKVTQPLGYLQKPFEETDLRVALEIAQYTAGIEIERKNFHKALVESEKQYRNLFNSMVDGFAVHEMIFDDEGKPCDYRFLKVNPAFERYTGLKASAIEGKTALEVIPELEKVWIENYGNVVLMGKPLQFENYSRQFKKYFEVSAYRFDVNQFACSFVDITARKKAEESLARESEINSILAEISKQLMSPENDMNTITDLILKHSLSVTNSQHGYTTVVDQRTGNNVIYSSVTPMEEKYPVKSQERYFFPRNKEGLYPRLCGHPMNTRKPFYTNHPSKHPASEGVPEGHMPINNFLSVPVLIDGKLAGQIALGNSKDGYSKIDLKTVEQIGELYALTIQREWQESEKEALEEQLRHMQKIEAIGTLAGGIAHDFNNILQPIMGYANMAMRNTDKSDNNHKYLSSILTASKRAKELVQQILTFSRKTEKEKQPVKVQIIVKEALKLLRSSLPTTIEIRQQIDSNCGMVMADPTMIHQITMNLTTNAFHAMRETGGIMEVSLKPIELKMEDCREDNLYPGSYICLTVTDSGIGMKPEILGKIFDPYFTTKDLGEGTGLGLSVIMGIVKGCKGAIRASSEPGIGSEFKVFLPQIEAEIESQESETDPSVLTGNENILLVDDEAAIAELIKEMLEEQGYRVTERTSSLEALEVFRSQNGKFDLVISDMTMPNMTGVELTRELLKIRPDLPVILCTGFSELINEGQIEALGIRKLLMKPASRLQLCQAIREILDSP